MNKVISVATDFTPMPYGRYREHGAYSAQVFREDILLPALRSYKSVEVILDGCHGFGSSFLEEVFGGLVRYGDFTKEYLHNALTITSNNVPSRQIETWGYIDEAEVESP